MVTLYDGKRGEHTEKGRKEHNHLPDSTRAEVLRAKESIKIRAVASAAPPVQIIQNVFRRVQKVGLQSLYSSDGDFSSSVRQLCALEFLPPHRIRSNYDEIKTNFPPSASGFLEWLEKNYVVGKPRQLPCGIVIRAPQWFPPDLWSVDQLIAEGQPPWFANRTWGEELREEIRSFRRSLRGTFV
ncbi:hypothetical protein HPB48_009954 [Haemaphysalis longicornis]|uniref:Uncharacterized protein n=1 Tax=Haemaphysalis longicornis TaxID=44386 RepID=A0A9J6GTR1_HAELO|nr:hypothetical protein HPB48_009954 [Haemaphysalis longicornis]